MNIRNIKILTISIVLFLVIGFILGQNGFKIKQDYANTTIVNDNYKYYIKETNSRADIFYKGRRCSIHYATQNKDKSLTAMKVACIPFTTIVLTKNFRIIRVPLRYVILISGKKIIYKVKNPTICSLKWINSDKLQIILPYEKVIVDKRGKIIERTKYKQNQINLLPEDEKF